MKILHWFFPKCQDQCEVVKQLVKQLSEINTQLSQLNMKVSEIKANVEAAVAKLQKARDEILAAIQKLKDELSDQTLPQEATDALAALDAKAGELDDIVPDSPEPTPEP